MARTKRPPQTEQAEWKLHEENELLAWLDYNIERHEGYKSFLESVSKHLSKECDVTYTDKQCQRKLYKFWRSYGDENAKKVAELHQRGSRCLTHLPGERRDFILARALQLCEIDFHSPRRLRSASQLSEGPSRRHVALDQPVLSRSKTGRGDCYHGTRLELPSVVITSKKAAHTERLEEGNNKRRCLPDQTYRTSTNDQVLKAEARGVGIYSSAVATDDNVVSSDDDDDGCNSGTHTESSEIDEVAMVLVSSLTTFRHEGTPCTPLSSDEVESLKIELEKLKKHIQQMEQAQSESNSLNEVLRARLRVAENRHKVNDERLSFLKRSEMVRVDNISVEQQLKNQITKSEMLQEKLDKARYIGKFTRIPWAGEIRYWREKDIQNSMKAIDFLMKQFLFNHDGINKFDPPHIDNDGDLAMLIRRSIGLSSSMPVSVDTITVRLSDLSLQAVVRAVTAASLCEWVFLNDLQEPGFMGSILLDEYRAHLRTRDGESSLRNLDFVVHHSLLNGPLFQEHILPSRAKKLAYRLEKALSSFFPKEQDKQKDQDRQSADVSLDSFSTWGAENDKRVARRDKLINIFTMALKIKYQFVTSSDRFEAVLHPPHTPFQPDCMKPETMEGSAMRTVSHSVQNQEVKLCLLPSLCVVEHNCTELTYKNFVPSDISARRDIERLTEATVVVGPS